MLSHDINSQSLQITIKSGQLDSWELAKRDPVLAVRSMIHLKPLRCAQPRPNKNAGIKRKKTTCEYHAELSPTYLGYVWHWYTTNHTRELRGALIWTIQKSMKLPTGIQKCLTFHAYVFKALRTICLVRSEPATRKFATQNSAKK